MIKAVIFDFFGVLVGDGFESTYRLAGGDPSRDKDFIRKLLDKANRSKITVDEFQNQICQQLGIPKERYQRAIAEAEHINYDLLEYIKTLRPKYKTAILSNVNKGGLESRIERDILNQFFDEIIVSGEVGFIKPEPEIYHLAAERLGVKVDECIFIDDRQPYVDAANQLGMKSILYEDFLSFKKQIEKLV